MTQNIDHTNKPVLEKEIADILGWWRARRKNIRWMGETYDDDGAPKDEEMDALLTLFNNMCDERVANYREALSLYGAPQCYHLHHPRKYQHKLGNCPVENRINQLTKDNLLKGEIEMGAFPADKLRERHPNLWAKLRMDIMKIRHGEIRPRVLEIDAILTTLQPILKEDFTTPTNEESKDDVL